MPSKIHGQREHDGRDLVAGDVVQRGEVAELHRARLAREHLGRLDQLRGRLLLALGVDHPRPAQPLGLGLLGDGADHALVEVDVFDLHIGDLDPPGVGLPVQDLLEVGVQPVTLGQHLVELVLAEHRA